MIKGDDNYEKCFLFLRKMWQMFSDIFHMCTDVNGENLKKSDHLFTTDVQNTNWWISVLPVPSLFSPRVLSSPSIFVLRMVLNECTYRHTHVPLLLLLLLQFASLNEREWVFITYSDFEKRENRMERK